MRAILCVALAGMVVASCEKCDSPADVNVGVGVGSGGATGGVSVGRSCGPGYISIGTGNSWHVSF